ncbi:hypothetical protein HU200_017527 [Digitaria exilis]|uniref:Trichome birefringence-like C-terminal domain-containing protein n=1 Tax=Digitaria exilis TaxID=1010633 RepID=A0A835KHQ4_9POAL|nr:hypothetical protein HU200_017527 [Digitaria exilis]
MVRSPAEAPRRADRLLVEELRPRSGCGHGDGAVTVVEPGPPPPPPTTRRPPWGCCPCRSPCAPRGKVVLRTVTPAHFENGEWNTGGDCVRTLPFRRGERTLGAVEAEYRAAQVGIDLSP